MAISNQQIAQQAVKRLQEWIDSQPQVPVYKGRINKTVICQKLNISKSSIGSNKKLKAMFNDLESNITSYKVQDIKGERERQLQKKVDSLEKQLALAKKEINVLKNRIAINDYLLETGRMIDA